MDEKSLVCTWPRGWQRSVAVSGLFMLILAVGFSRIYLGAHFLSDVVGGYAAGGCWLFACISTMELMRRRIPKPQAASKILINSAYSD
jgi:membrane-associated phospholipid phosphatase